MVKLRRGQPRTLGFIALTYQEGPMIFSQQKEKDLLFRPFPYKAWLRSCRFPALHYPLTKHLNYIGFASPLSMPYITCIKSFNFFVRALLFGMTRRAIYHFRKTVQNLHLPFQKNPRKKLAFTLLAISLSIHMKTFKNFWIFHGIFLNNYVLLIVFSHLQQF